MSREHRQQIAQETLEIVQKGFYIAPSGKQVNIAGTQKRSERVSFVISPDEGKLLVKDLEGDTGSYNVSYEVKNESTVKTIIENALKSIKIAALNFASAKNPGGGFINGAIAQEEALCYASGLYNTQINHMTYYDSNRDCRSAMYTDYAIYSPDVVFFRNAEYNLLEEPVTCSILTLPAVNMGQIKEKREDIVQAKQVMKDRMRLALSILAKEGNDIIILGAYGCGVFGNNPNTIAQYWKELLINEGYGKHFKHIIFAVLDKTHGDNIRAFEKVFG